MGTVEQDLARHEREQDRLADEEAAEEARMAELRENAERAADLAVERGEWDAATDMGLDLNWLWERQRDGIETERDELVDHLVDTQQYTSRPMWMQREAQIRRCLEGVEDPPHPETMSSSVARGMTERETREVIALDRHRQAVAEIRRILEVR